MTQAKTILKVDNLKQYFRVDKKTVVKAVDGVSFEVYEGETFSVVGESGSGKSTLGRSIIKIYDDYRGDVTFLDELISEKMDTKSLKSLRSNMQMIFQDPMASLNPRKKVLDIVSYGLEANNGKLNHDQKKDKVVEVLNSVGLSEAFLNRYPHQFSGGQRQRIGIARSLILEPKFIIADEIISALDVSIQAQVINLMKKLQKERNLTYMFIAHDLSMVRSISDRVAVMHLGHIVELGTVDDIYNNPLHPYTRSLLSAIPLPDPKVERERVRLNYDKSSVDYNAAIIHYITDSHQVLAVDEDLTLWKNGNYDDTLKIDSP